MTPNRTLRSLLTVALLTCGSQALAASTSASLNVTATVSANCLISAAPVAFGAYDPVAAHATTALDASGAVSVTCTSGSAATITLGQGTNPNAGSSDASPLRRMSNGAAGHLSYVLYSDSGRTTAWGNTSLTGVAHTGTGSSTALTVYGRITSGQNAPTGSYADTVVATVTF